MPADPVEPVAVEPVQPVHAEPAAMSVVILPSSSDAQSIDLEAGALPEARAVPFEVQAVPVQPQPMQVQVTIPPDIISGQVFQAQLQDGQPFFVTVPPGSNAGETIAVSYMPPVATATQVPAQATMVLVQGQQAMERAVQPEELRLLPVLLRARSLKWSSAIDIVLILVYAWFFRVPLLLVLLPGFAAGYYAGDRYSTLCAYCNAVFIVVLCGGLTWQMVAGRLRNVYLFVVIIIMCEICLLFQVKVFVKLLRSISAEEIGYLRAIPPQRVHELVRFARNQQRGSSPVLSYP